MAPMLSLGPVKEGYIGIPGLEVDDVNPKNELFCAAPTVSKDKIKPHTPTPIMCSPYTGPHPYHTVCLTYWSRRLSGLILYRGQGPTDTANKRWFTIYCSLGT